MTTTVALQRRTTVVGAYGGAEYAIETYVSDRGDLSDSGVFLMEIVSETDPTQDVLARVASVADLSTYVMDRVVAVRGGSRYFRASVVRVSYTDLNVAKTAVDVMEDFINRLVTAVQSFNTDFSTSNELGPPLEYATLEFPLIDDAIEARLVGDIETAAAGVVSVESSITAQEAQCAVYRAEISSITAQVQELRSVETLLNDLANQVNTSVASLSSLITQGEAMAADLDAGIDAYQIDVVSKGLSTPANPSYDYFYDPDRSVTDGGDGSTAQLLDPFITALHTGSSDLTALSRKTSLLASAESSIQGQISIKESDLSTTEASAEACASQKRVLDGDLTRAQLDLQDAIDALIAVCPDYDVDSIEGV